MKKTLIFGTGSTGQKIYNEIKGFKEVVGFLDNDKSRWGGEKQNWTEFLYLAMRKC